MSVGKIIRIVGNSPESWAKAAQEAVREAARTIRNIHGIEATDFTAEVDESGNITEYRCTVNIAFRVAGRGHEDEEEEEEEAGEERGGGESRRATAGARGGARGSRAKSGARGAKGGR